MPFGLLCLKGEMASRVSKHELNNEEIFGKWIKEWALNHSCLNQRANP